MPRNGHHDSDSDLPSRWHWSTIGEVCSFVNRGRAPSYTDSTGVPVINQRCIRWHGIDFSHIKFTAEGAFERVDERQQLRQGDVLWNSTGTGTIGRAALFKESDRYPLITVDTHVTILRPRDVLPEFLQLWISSPFVQHRMDELQGGSTNQVELSRQAAMSCAIPVPPTAQQQEMVDTVQELFGEIEAGEQELAQAKADLARYRRAVLKAAVTGELTREWREKNPPKETGADLLARIFKERRARWEKAELTKLIAKGKPPKNDDWKSRYIAPAVPDLSHLPELPVGWIWTTVEQLGFVESGSTPKGIENYSNKSGEVPWFKVSSMTEPGNEQEMSASRWHLSRKDAHALGLKLLPPGTIVFPKRGGAILTNKKRRLAVEAGLDLNLMGFSPLPSSAHVAELFFEQLDLRAIYDGSNVPQINYADVAQLIVPLPPTAESKVALNLARASLDAGMALDSEIASLARNASKFRQATLAAAFRGELTT